MTFSFHRILYLEGRPEAHYFHRKLANSLGATIRYVDQYLRWQDKNKSKFYNVYAWIINAVFLKEKKKWNFILVDNLHPTPVLLKKLKLINRNQKIVCYLGSHTLYLTYSNYFSSFVKAFHIWLLKNYDILICEGGMSESIADQLLSNYKNKPKTYKSFLGIPNAKIEKLLDIDTSLDSYNVLCIANGPGEFREYYKGIDIAIESILECKRYLPAIKLFIAGDWNSEIINSYSSRIPEKHFRDICFLGKVEDMTDIFGKSSLYLHVSRGDAFPSSSIEAMCAGLIPLLSEWTGTKEIIDKKYPELITSLDRNDISKKIQWYFNLESTKKIEMRNNIRKLAKDYSEEKAIKSFQDTFNNIMDLY